MRRFFPSCLPLVAGAAVVCGAVASRADASGGAAGAALFNNRVRPLLEQSCLECHGGKRTRSGFDLSTRESLLLGGDNGPAVVLGDPDASRLIRMVRHLEDPGMPYKKPALPGEDIAALAEWVQLGAPYDAPLAAGEVRGKELFWAVNPLVKPAVPETGSPWVRSPIDAFILAKHREAGLAPAPEADRRTLIRRLNYDLHGLAPAPEEIEAFVNDTDERAYEKLVDRLLASPRHGERWGRHWLDVVHYADTHGFDKDKRRPNAWPYRDYVIRALNEDKPYGRFVAEQLAGDVLYPDDPDGIAATGFIAAGPWDFVGHYELREGTTDKKITRLLDRDDMVASTMSSFTSLTVHCARCHDHKFDPISQRDYYGLQAVFAGVDRADRSHDPDKALHQKRRGLTREQREVEAALRDLVAARNRVSSARIREIDADLAAARSRVEAAAAVAAGPPAPRKGHHSQVARSRYETKWVQIDLGQPMAIDEIVLIPAVVEHDGRSVAGYGFPRRFKVEVSDDSKFSSATVVADETGADHPNPGSAPYLCSAGGKTGRYVRVTATRLWQRGEERGREDWVFALAELAVIAGGRNVALEAAATASDNIPDASTWHPRFVNDGSDSRSVLFDPSPTDGYHSAASPDRDSPKWVQIDLGEAAPVDQVVLVPARSAEKPEEAGYGFPVRFRIEASGDAAFETAVVIADRTTGDVDNPGFRPMSFTAPGPVARHIRVTATQLWQRPDGEEHLLALAEVQVTSGLRNAARGAAVSALDSLESGRWGVRHLVDGHGSLMALRDPSPGNGFQSETAPEADSTKWVQLDLGQSVPVDEIRLVPGRPSTERFGHGFPVRFRLEVSDDPDFAAPIAVADHTEADYANPGGQTQVFRAARTARYVRLTATRLWKQESEKFLLALAELEVRSGAANLARVASVIASDSTEKDRWGARFLNDGYSSTSLLEEIVPTAGYRSAPATRSSSVKWIQVDLGRKVPVDQVRLVPARDRGAANFPARFRVELSNEADFANGVVRVFDGSVKRRPDDADPFEVVCRAEPARYVRLTATRLGGSAGEYALALSELQVLSEGVNVAQGAQVSAGDSVEQEEWAAAYAVDGIGPRGRLSNVGDVLRSMVRLANAWEAVRRLVERRHFETVSLLDEVANRRLEHLQEQADSLDASIAGLPPQKKVYAGTDDFTPVGLFWPAKGPRPVHVLERGDVNKPGDLAVPSGLDCVPGLGSALEIANPEYEGERRAALARWITDPANAVTWRSIVNRVWHYHFGRGIVDTPNDFGNMGSPPTHPELLDWLAAEFLAHGQSLKWLHREIVTSATYRQAAAHREEFAAIDADNRLLWRFNRQRLDAESVRDTVLSLAGKLDLAMGGPGYDLFAFEDDHSPRYLYEKHDVDAAAGHRRSVYRFVVRSVPDPFLETLDCAEPSQSVPVRNTTITALQALSLLNNPLMVRMAGHFAARVERMEPTTEDRVRAVWRLALGREPDPEDLEELVDYTARHGLAATCRLIFNTSEFMFVD